MRSHRPPRQNQAGGGHRNPRCAWWELKYLYLFHFVLLFSIFTSAVNDTVLKITGSKKVFSKQCHRRRFLKEPFSKHILK